jgi:hypothetical protein
LNLEGLDAAQVDDLGGVTDEMVAAQMEILDENEVSDSGEDTVGADSEDEEYFLQEELTTQWHQSSKLGPDWYTLYNELMRCD